MPPSGLSVGLGCLAEGPSVAAGAGAVVAGGGLSPVRSHETSAAEISNAINIWNMAFIRVARAFGIRDKIINIKCE